MTRRRRPLADTRIAKPPQLAPYGLGTTSCGPVLPGRAVRVCMTRPEKPSRPLQSSIDVCRLLRGAVNTDRESFYALHLDTQNRVLGIEEIARGGLDSVEVHPREVFKSAILGNAAAIIVAHNHPSGNAEPSNADLQMTQRLIRAAEVLGVPVRDHVIVAAEGCTSLRDRSLVSGFGNVRRARRRRHR